MIIHRHPHSFKPRILLVDPNIFFRLSMQNELTENGFDVRTASDSIEGIRILLNENKFSAVISNQDLMYMDGVSFLSAATMLSPDISTILLEDADSSHQDIVEGINLILKKPFQKNQWIHNIESTLA